jgi:hypothetical protein
MMIPYPSSSPIVNYTYTTLPDSAGTIVTAIGVGVLGTTLTAVAVVQFLKPRAAVPPAPPAPPAAPPAQELPPQEEEKTHIVISSSDKAEILQLLQDHQKEYVVLS